MKSQTKRIGYIAIYYFIAVAFRYYILKVRPNFFTNADVFIQILLEGIGPLLGGLLMIKVFKRKNDLSLFPIGFWTSIILVAIPILLFTLVGIINTGTPYYSLGPKIVGGAIIYGLFEEYGWRAYLQTELKDLKKIYKYLIISVLWYAWHLEFGFTLNHLMSYGFILAGTIGIGKVADVSKSLILVALFHAFFNLFYISKELEGVTNFQTIGILSISILSIIGVMVWNGRKKRLALENQL
ncbi:MAG: CPBP family intramembrane glutamic endopeptidase [Flavobacteriaceae bacterium]